MLAFSVREALRQAVAAFSPDRSATVVDLPSPATPEAVFWAVDRVRRPADGSANAAQSAEAAEAAESAQVAP
jgi:xanthine dehydrogenase large subunit